MGGFFMIVSIDHGNYNCKTSNKIFISGILESDTSSYLGGDCLHYNGKYYTLTDKRIPYLRDKTVDDRFFVLTLFAIAYEIEHENAYSKEEIIDIQLLIGLPPAHFSNQYKKFEDYFKRDDYIDFKLNDKEYSIYIDTVVASPQAFASVMPVYNQIKDISKAIIVDIGGMTVDFIGLKKGIPDISVCDSLENGVIKLYNNITSRLSSDFDILCEESDIDAVIRHEESVFPQEAIAYILKSAKNFVSDLVDKLRERGIDLKTSKAIFTGGGSLLLREFINEEQRIGSLIIVDSISANAKGYEILYKTKKANENG